jgi:20S proteasome alpha/beta subunit
LELAHPPTKKVPMTIAMGFPCRDGLVLCADTQEVISGYVKTDTEKMTIIQSAPDYNVVITGAGDGDFIEMVIQEVHAALNSNHPGEPIQRVIKKTLLQLFNDRVVPYANFPYDERPAASLLLGIQSDGVVTLYKSRGAIFRRMNAPECIGTGLALGKSLIAQLFTRDLQLPQAGIVALYILHQAKTWVDGCGGNSDILLLSSKKLEWRRLPTEDVKELEKHFDDFSNAMRPILISAADRVLSNEAFDAEMKKFSRDMFALRSKFMEFGEFWKRLGEMYGIELPPIQEP